MFPVTLLPVNANNFRKCSSLLAYYCKDISWVQHQLTIYKSSWRTRVYSKWYSARPGVCVSAARIREALNRCWNFQWIIEFSVGKQSYYWSLIKTKEIMFPHRRVNLKGCIFHKKINHWLIVLHFTIIVFLRIYSENRHFQHSIN